MADCVCVAVSGSFVSFRFHFYLVGVFFCCFLVIHDTGAHGFSMGYQYNARLRSSELLYKLDGSVEMIRRAEKPEDYFSTLYGFNFED